MKITSEKHYAKNDAIDIMSIINDLNEEYGSVFWNTYDEQMFIYRPIGRMEYKQLITSDVDDMEKEDLLCKTCLLYPEDFDFDNCLAGIPNQLAEDILKNSFLDSLESKQLVINHFRIEMSEFDNQVTCIINEAFPNIDIEEIENWSMEKTAKYLSRAEWKLNALRQVPIDYNVSNSMMEDEWTNQHSKPEEKNNAEVQTNIEPKKEEPKKIAQPRAKSQAEMDEFKRKFPELNWGAEINPSENINSMQDGLDTVSPALRVGYY